ncbi:hypothetical protein [Actinophytocola sp.]|uniref:hypothetical protein n=1 Tax=Actinophytocola sp. TaxID=1872138 RepID=UPI00389A0C65
MASWNHDGTQDPSPPPLMNDPLSGLVTGGKYDGEAVRIRVIEPAKPDIEAVRTAMEAVLDENSELRVHLPGATPAPAPRPRVAPPVDAAAPTPPVGIPAPAARMPVVPEEAPPPRMVRPPRRRWSPGLAAVGLLLIVMAVLVIVMLASLIDAISSIFG